MNLGDPMPERMYTSEVLERVGVCHAKWKSMQAEGKAPTPAYRGKGGYVFRGIDIARLLGLVDEKEGIGENDPFVKGAQNLGKAKGR